MHTVRGVRATHLCYSTSKWSSVQGGLDYLYESTIYMIEIWHQGSDRGFLKPKGLRCDPSVPEEYSRVPTSAALSLHAAQPPIQSVVFIDYYFISPNPRLGRNAMLIYNTGVTVSSMLEVLYTATLCHLNHDDYASSSLTGALHAIIRYFFEGTSIHDC